MSVEPVPGMRSTISDGPEGLTILMPSRRVVVFLVFIPIWLCGWLLGETFAIRTLVGGMGGRQPPMLFLAVWLTFWTVGGLAIATAWLWTAFGRERLVVGSGRFVHQYELFAFAIPREYDVTAIRNLHAVPNPGATSFGGRRNAFGVGSIAFDYGSKTVYVGRGLDEAEGRMIVDRIRARHAIPGADALP